MKIQPHGRRVLVKMLPEDIKFTNSLLYKPDTVHEDAIGYGVVQAVGKHKINREPGWKEETEVRVGDKVAFIKFLREVHTNQGVASIIGDDLILIEFKDILGVIEDQ
jgi:co-chaperonin GroES (HSP10)